LPPAANTCKRTNSVIRDVFVFVAGGGSDTGYWTHAPNVRLLK
jgi:hypothetical protein